jgi:hypothetical protein
MKAYWSEVAALEYLEKNTFKEVSTADHESACYAFAVLTGVVRETVEMIKRRGGLLLIGGVK